MSLFGSLYSSVSGIQAQGTAIGIISDNISNVNTIGYKGGSQYFGTLVTNSGSTVSYSPGGVRAQNRQQVTQQGLVQATNSPLDLAISGNGLFVVQDSAKAADNPTISYTRAGSFRTDSLGNFTNAAGLYLKAWPLDIDGNIPANSASLDSLQIVNIGSASGNASATTRVEVGMNLNASQAVYKGSGSSGKPGSDSSETVNLGNVAKDILIPNGNLTVGDSLRVTVDGTLSYDFGYGGFEESLDIVASGPFFGASNASSPFNTGAGLVSGDGFTISRSGSSTPLTFKFVPSSPNTQEGEFNSLATLAEAINRADGMTARVATTGGATKLFIAAEDAREGLAFAQTAGSTADFPTTLGLATVAAVSTNRFASIEGLSKLVSDQTSNNLTSKLVDKDTSNAVIQISNTNPLTTIQFSNAGGGGSDFLTEFGMAGTLISPSYDGSATSTTSMASGAIQPAFERSVRVYDSLGEGHDLTVGFIKVGNNAWRAEVYTNDPAETTNGRTQIASGKIVFNGDGTLASIDSSLTTAVQPISWSNNSASGNVVFNFGTAGELGEGKTDGLRQFAGFYNVDFLTQNGAEAGLLDSVSIDKSGYIIANFNNGQTQRLYKIPLADFANANGLIGRNGNTFIQSFASGEVNLKEPGTSGAGTISPSSLESANTELSEELTDMIVAQRAYQASAKVITTANQLLDELNRLTS